VVVQTMITKSYLNYLMMIGEHFVGEMLVTK